MTAAELMRQAKDTAHDYLAAGRRDLNELCGAGYADRHPQVLVGYMIAAALDYLACWGIQEVTRSLDGITDAGIEVSASVKEIAQAGDRIADALGDVAAAIRSRES